LVPCYQYIGAGEYKDSVTDPFEGPGEPRIVFEGPGLVAVHKPCRMHSAPGAEGGDLCAWVFERYPEAAAVRAGGGTSTSRRPTREGGLLHRLDYETSGLVLFARSDRAFASLLKQQDEGLFLKEYLARAAPGGADGPAGSRPARGTPLGLDSEAWASARDDRDLERMAKLVRSSRACGLEARIECAFRSFGPGGAAVACLGRDFRGGGPAERDRVAYRADLIDARASAAPCGLERADRAVDLTLGLAKGFRHQLRAQLAWIGLPIAGDPIYGGASAGRLFLHASRVAFADPETGTPVVLGPAGLAPAEDAMPAFASLLLGGNSGRLSLHG